MKSFKKPVMMATAGAIALAGIGGGTFALWSDTATVNAGTVTSGDLAIQELETTTRYLKTSGEVDFNTHKAVPGDRFLIQSSFDVGMKGDNMKAAIEWDPIESKIDPELAEYVIIEHNLASFHKTLDVEALNLEEYPKYYTSIEEYESGQTIPYVGPSEGIDGVRDPRVVALDPVIDGKPDFAMEYSINFSRWTPERLLTKQNLMSLNDLNVRIVQKPSTG